MIWRYMKYISNCKQNKLLRKQAEKGTVTESWCLHSSYTFPRPQHTAAHIPCTLHAQRSSCTAWSLPMAMAKSRGLGEAKRHPTKRPTMKPDRRYRGNAGQGHAAACWKNTVFSWKTLSRFYEVSVIYQADLGQVQRSTNYYIPVKTKESKLALIATCKREPTHALVSSYRLLFVASPGRFFRRLFLGLWAPLWVPGIGWRISIFFEGRSKVDWFVRLDSMVTAGRWLSIHLRRVSAMC